MVTRSDYFNEFFKLMVRHQDKSYEQLYEMVEEWNIERMGKKRYSNYAGFRVAKHTYTNIMRSKG